MRRERWITAADYFNFNQIIPVFGFRGLNWTGKVWKLIIIPPLRFQNMAQIILIGTWNTILNQVEHETLSDSVYFRKNVNKLQMQNVSQLVPIPGREILNEPEKSSGSRIFVQLLLKFFWIPLGVQGELVLLPHPRVPPPPGRSSRLDEAVQHLLTEQLAQTNLSVLSSSHFQS